MRLFRHGDSPSGENRSGDGRLGEQPLDHGHPRTNGTNGAHPTGLRTRTISLADRAPEDDNEPVDLVAVQADDELINALGAGLTVSASGSAGVVDDHVAAVLAAWRAEVDTEPIPELVDLDTAVATVRAARRPRHRARHLASVAAAVTLIAVTAGGVGLGASSAQPEDALWPVTKVLFSERADSIEAADRVEARITRAKQAIAAGRPDLAEQELQAAAADLPRIRAEEGGVELAAVQDFLVAKAEETPPGVPTDPGAPLVNDQGRAVPPGAAISAPVSSSATTPPPVDSTTSDPGSADPSPQQSDEEPPAVPAPGPQVARVLPPPNPQPLVPEAPVPAPEDQREPADPPSPPADEGGSTSPTDPEPPQPQVPVDPPEEIVPVPEPESVPVPEPQSSGLGDSLGATAQDTSTTDAPATS